jgi:hypothetical protein
MFHGYRWFSGLLDPFWTQLFLWFRRLIFITLPLGGIQGRGGARTRMWTTSLIAVSQIVFLLALSATASAEEWRFYDADAGGTRSSPLKQINRQNVRSLKRAWTYHLGGSLYADALDGPILIPGL